MISYGTPERAWMTCAARQPPARVRSQLRRTILISATAEILHDLK
jgi:hypothetical protein